MYAVRCGIAAVLGVMVVGGVAANAKTYDPCICNAVIKIITLNAAEQAVVSAHIKPCWGEKTHAYDTLVGNMAVPPSPGVPLQVMVDADGTVRGAKLAFFINTTPLSDAAYLSFGRLAYQAATNPRCDVLPLPKALLGQGGTFTFQFSP
jgi:hypothetical protein